jgi:lipoprotein NlpD
MVATAPPDAPAPTPVAPASTASTAAKGGWLWPAEGTLAGRFGAAGGKGIAIAGQRNTPVLAVAPGKVVYSGSGLRGYGRLLIVKHAGEYLSAYAHNETILVKEGDTVTAGQKIALMGDSDADRVKLHFEIRRYGKPLDPLNYLPERS